MIPLSPFRLELDMFKVKQYAGTKFRIEKCFGEGRCNKADAHSSHFWFEETICLDEMSIEVTTNERRKEQRKIWVPIRWYNFEFSYLKCLEKAPTEKNTLKLINQALDYARLNCFDPTGEPQNMASKLGFSSYSKFLAMVEENILRIEEASKYKLNAQIPIDGSD